MESWQQLPCPDSQLQQENKFRLNFNASVPSGTTSRKRKCPLSRHHQHARTDKPTQIKKRKKKTRSLEEIFFLFLRLLFLVSFTCEVGENRRKVQMEKTRRSDSSSVFGFSRLASPQKSFRLDSLSRMLVIFRHKLIEHRIMYMPTISLKNHFPTENKKKKNFRLCRHG